MDVTETPGNIDLSIMVNSPLATVENSHSSKSKPLDNLPNEVLSMVINLLPTYSAASLALTSKTMCNRVGTRYFVELRKGKRIPRAYLQSMREPDDYALVLTPRTAWEAERVTFLQILDRDFPHLILCHFCQRLHSLNPAGAEFKSCAGPNMITRLHGLSYTYARVAWVMKHHRLGRNPQHLVNEQSEFFEEGNGYEIVKSLMPRIVSDAFHLRTQYEITLLADPCVRLPRTCTPIVCCHLQNWQDGRKCLTKYMRCRLNHIGEENGACKLCMGLKQCRKCLTEYQVDILSPARVVDRACTILITVWQRFGEVRSPLDPEWQRHFAKLADDQLKFERGSIKEAFADVREDFPEQVLVKKKPFKKGPKPALKKVARSNNGQRRTFSTLTVRR
ncbi:hypothetical protein B7494_g2052 [Chlorociboria aeruginascens]|nr:hypothetical protein B7494_g2052 [Chlorociboria aeruginascens]